MFTAFDNEYERYPRVVATYRYSDQSYPGGDRGMVRLLRIGVALVFGGCDGVKRRLTGDRSPSANDCSPAIDRFLRTVQLRCRMHEHVGEWGIVKWRLEKQLVLPKFKGPWQMRLRRVAKTRQHVD
jgi:hypothetical protein